MSDSPLRDALSDHYFNSVPAIKITHLQQSHVIFPFLQFLQSQRGAVQTAELSGQLVQRPSSPGVGSALLPP